MLHQNCKTKMEVGEEEKNQLIVESALSQKLKNVPTPQIIINSKKKKDLNIQNKCYPYGLMYMKYYSN